MVAPLTEPPVATAGTASITSPLALARRIVVKIGSSLLVEDESGRVKRSWLDTLADDIAALKAGGREVIVVSSGTIAIGRRHLALPLRDLRLEEKQAAAATGQIRLAHAYQEAMARHGITVAQVLLSPDDTEQRRRHLNARATLSTLIGLGALAVVNENDTVSTAEMRFGDNDRLGARVAQMISADMLVLLSDVDGLYDRDPRSEPGARHLAVIDAITTDVEAMAGGAASRFSSGGMITKVTAARIATSAGCATIIADGREPHPLARLGDGGRHTLFKPSGTPRTARKNWIASGLKPAGRLTLDAGAVAALKRGKSLLPAGITQVSGGFDRGDLVTLHGPDGAEIGAGLSAYGANDAARIIGHKSGDIEKVLGYRGREEIIHRDDLVLN